MTEQKFEPFEIIGEKYKFDMSLVGLIGTYQYQTAFQDMVDLHYAILNFSEVKTNYKKTETYLYIESAIKIFDWLGFNPDTSYTFDYNEYTLPNSVRYDHESKVWLNRTVVLDEQMFFETILELSLYLDEMIYCKPFYYDDMKNYVVPITGYTEHVGGLGIWLEICENYNPEDYED